MIPKMLVFVACKVYSSFRKAINYKQYVSMYHASLTTTTKEQIRADFASGKSQLRCLIAIVAFGMVCQTYNALRYCFYTQVNNYREWISQMLSWLWCMVSPVV